MAVIEAEFLMVSEFGVPPLCTRLSALSLDLYQVLIRKIGHGYEQLGRSTGKLFGGERPLPYLGLVIT